MPPASPPPSDASSDASLDAAAERGVDGDLQRRYAEHYAEIKRVARARLVQSGGLRGLNTTALVNEGFLRLARQQALRGDSPGEFFAYVGQVLRSVVIDHVRAEQRDKRGSGQVMLTLTAAADVPAPLGDVVDLIALDRGLRRMRQLDGGLYELIEAQAFAGLSVDELATLRGVTSRTIHRDLLKARALLNEVLA